MFSSPFDYQLSVAQPRRSDNPAPLSAAASALVTKSSRERIELPEQLPKARREPVRQREVLTVDPYDAMQRLSPWAAREPPAAEGGTAAPPFPDDAERRSPKPRAAIHGAGRHG
jgi:hypothetical protein